METELEQESALARLSGGMAARPKQRSKLIANGEPGDLDLSPPQDAWNNIYKQRGRVFTEPHQDMPGIARLLKARQARTILDLGCGSGRHAVFLAREGFAIHGLDNSPEGIRMARRWLASEGLKADLKLHSMTDGLPYRDAFFDAVIAVQVIHHAIIDTIRRIVQEIERVLRRGGLVFVTVTTFRDHAGASEEIEPNTFIPLEGLEKGLPHHYFSPGELREVFGRFDVTGISQDTTGHYCLWAFKP